MFLSLQRQNLLSGKINEAAIAAFFMPYNLKQYRLHRVGKRITPPKVTAE